MPRRQQCFWFGKSYPKDVVAHGGGLRQAAVLVAHVLLRVFLAHGVVVLAVHQLGRFHLLGLLEVGVLFHVLDRAIPLLLRVAQPVLHRVQLLDLHQSAR